MPYILFPPPQKKVKTLVNRDIEKLPSSIDLDRKNLRWFTIPNKISTCYIFSTKCHTMTTNITNITDIISITMITIIKVIIILTMSVCNNMSVC